MASWDVRLTWFDCKMKNQISLVSSLSFDLYFGGVPVRTCNKAVGKQIYLLKRQSRFDEGNTFDPLPVT